MGDPPREEEDFFGTSVVVAKRLCDKAAGGQIMASELVAALVGSRGGYRFRPLGSLGLKGLAQPVPAVEVEWAEPDLAPAGAEPRPAPVDPERRRGVLIGRDRELSLLRTELAPAPRGSAVCCWWAMPALARVALPARWCSGRTAR